MKIPATKNRCADTKTILKSALLIAGITLAGMGASGPAFAEIKYKVKTEETVRTGRHKLHISGVAAWMPMNAFGVAAKADWEILSRITLHGSTLAPLYTTGDVMPFMADVGMDLYLFSSRPPGKIGISYTHNAYTLSAQKVKYEMDHEGPIWKKSGPRGGLAFFRSPIGVQGTGNNSAPDVALTTTAAYVGYRWFRRSHVTIKFKGDGVPDDLEWKFRWASLYMDLFLPLSISNAAPETGATANRSNEKAGGRVGWEIAFGLDLPVVARIEGAIIPGGGVLAIVGLGVGANLF